MLCNLSSTSSLVHDSLRLFCDISAPRWLLLLRLLLYLVHTRFGFKENINSFWCGWHVGSFRDADTAVLTKVLASSPLISFCVALGNATSHFMPHGRLPGMYWRFCTSYVFADATAFVVLKVHNIASFASVMPSLS